MKRFSAAASLLVLIALVPSYAFAQQGNGACGNAPDVTAERAATFLGQPAALLGQYRDVAGSLSAAVRDLTISRPETLSGMASLANDASPDQLRAIGAGLGTAAAVCALTQPNTALRIQEAVLATNKPDVVNAYTSIVGDVATEAIPGLPATGETTAGGARSQQTTGSSSGALASATPNSFFGVVGNASRQSNVSLLAISPSN
ncbi:hypothetical protein [Bosea sp. ASV33]|uniref:hypothetical protein n=1 Tax=Bosea sp. ASV33 TaxID=2795106 RepID=UPI0018EB901A|nr:hypothetical protein [Bosea sp. ASV33]